MKASDLARPPISATETVDAETAICRNHKGLICETGDIDGRVFFCPIGKSYWRYQRIVNGMYAPLKYGPTGVL